MTESISTYPIQRLRAEFPVLKQEVNGRPLIYFDNAASSQKPIAVVETLREYYNHYHSNIHRGAHHLANLATEAFEGSRDKIANHLRAKAREEVIFTSGTTDGINLVAQTWGRQNIGKGDLIVISGLEHHSNLVPWQMLAEEKGAEITIIPVLANGALDQEVYAQLLQRKPKLVTFNHVSNSLGTINPVVEMTRAAKAADAVVLIDGAQSIPHITVDVQAIGCDFYVFSGHKAYGPTGIGVLWGRKALLESMPPWRGGGEMIADVTYERSTWNELPYKFEAGTPNIADVIALGVAIDWINQVGVEAIGKHEEELTQIATEGLKQIDGMRIIGEAPEKAGVVSFLIGDIHPSDVGILLDKMGVAVRTGHHCTQPLMHHFGIPGTVRASFAAYNTEEEVKQFVAATEKAAMMLG
jgi:cysteine desulfurase/selenocysteine lyase